MIKLKSFSVTNTDEANEFIKNNPPRSTEKQSGIVFHDGNILVIYDDGQPNPNDEVNVYKSMLEGERHKLMVTKHHLETVNLVRRDILNRIDELAPQGYTINTSISEARKLFPDKLDKATVTKVLEEISTLKTQLDGYEKSIVMDTHEVNRLNLSIKALENLISSTK